MERLPDEEGTGAAPCTLVWEIKKKKKPGCTPPLFIHLFELHMSAGMAGNRPRPQAGEVGLGFSQLVVQMAADGSQHKQEGWRWGLQGEEKKTLLRFFFLHDGIQKWKWRFASQDLILTGKGI